MTEKYIAELKEVLTQIAQNIKLNSPISQIDALSSLFMLTAGMSSSPEVKEEIKNIETLFAEKYPYLTGARINALSGSPSIHADCDIFDVSFDIKEKKITVGSDVLIFKMTSPEEFEKREKRLKHYNTGKALIDYADGKISRFEFVRRSDASTLKSRIVTFLNARKHLKKGRYANVDAWKEVVQKCEKNIEEYIQEYEKEQKKIASSKEEFPVLINHLQNDFPDYDILFREEICVNGFSE